MAMIDDIKTLLEYADNTQDVKINLWIGIYQQHLLNRINKLTLPVALEYIIEELVVNKLSGVNVKSIAVGDTKTEYVTGNADYFAEYEAELKKYSNKIHVY